MQYGLYGASKLNEKRYTTYTRPMWDLILKMEGRRGKKPPTKLKQLYTYSTQVLCILSIINRQTHVREELK